MWDELTITWSQAAAVVVATVGIYLAVVVLLRLTGPRVLSGFAAFDTAAAMAIGALVGRTILGTTPVLAAGVLGLVTLTVLQGALGWARSHALGARLIGRPPVLLLAHGRLIPSAMRGNHIVEGELRTHLRRSGVGSYAEVAAVVLEPTGSLSVLREGAPLDPDLFRTVRGAGLLFDH